MKENWVSKGINIRVVFTLADPYNLTSLDDIVAQGFEIYIYSLPCENHKSDD